MAEQEWETYHSKFEQIDRLFLLLVKVAEESGTNFMTMATAILEAGYRLPGGKAPLLTDEEFFEWCGTHYIKNCRGTRKMIACDRVVSICEDCRAQAQRDADNKFFGVK